MAAVMKKVSNLFGYERFKPFQEETIHELFKGRDVFLSVKTGGGKSMCYQAFQPFYSINKQRECVVLIVAPLISIMKEQCDYLESRGFTATYIGKDDTEDDRILQNKFQFVFTSPESILSVKKWRDHITSNEMVSLIVVDEAHVILHWGESDTETNEDPFRVWYSKLGELRSLIKCSMLLITATANKASRKAIKRKFCMTDCYEIIDNPERTNIKLFVHKFKSTLPLCDLFSFLLNLLEEKKELCPRYIIFCTSIKNCSNLFTMFRMELGASLINYVQMYHSETTEAVKDNIKMDMADLNGLIRILIATSAAGMGVNFKGVDNVINFGPPRDMDSFVQQFGRAGRDGSIGMALLLFNGKQCKYLDTDMKSFIQNESVCRMECVLAAYNSKPADRAKHLCCDVCSKQCQCGKDDCKKFEHLFFECKMSDSDQSDGETDFLEELFESDSDQDLLQLK